MATKKRTKKVGGAVSAERFLRALKAVGACKRSRYIAKALLDMHNGQVREMLRTEIGVAEENGACNDARTYGDSLGGYLRWLAVDMSTKFQTITTWDETRKVILDTRSLNKWITKKLNEE